MKILRLLTAVVLFVQMLSVGLMSATLTVPNPSREWTIGGLLDLINTNNPQGSSNFLVLTNGPGNGVACTNESGAMDFTGVNGSTGADNVGISTSVLREQLGEDVVALKQDPELIAILSIRNCFSRSEYKAFYEEKILLYIVVQSPTDHKYYRLYLNEPWPATYVPGGPNAVGSLLQKWGLSIPSARRKSTR